MSEGDPARHGLVLPWLEIGVAWWRKQPRPWFVACHVCGGLGLKDFERPPTAPSMVWIHFCKSRRRIARALEMHRHCSPAGHPGKPLPIGEPTASESPSESLQCPPL